MKAYFISFVALFLLTFGKVNANYNEGANSIVEDNVFLDSILPIGINDFYTNIYKDDFYTYICKDGSKRIFTYLSRDGIDYELYVCDDNASEVYRRIPLVYPRYRDEGDFFANGGCDFSRYTISKDKRYLYIVTRVNANSDGWTIEYQLFKIDCETLESKLICDCAGIALTDTGFSIAVARLTNGDTATCVADEIWVMHDEYLDWDGNVINVDKKEYNYNSLRRKYRGGKYTYVKGLSKIDPHNVY